MSTLTVARINTESNSTPLIIETGNNTSGFLKLESANDEMLFSGTARFAKGIVGLAPSAAFDTANVAFDKANAALANTTTTIDGTLTSTGSFIDSKGDVRDIPINNQIVGYGLVASDLGKTISTNTTVYVPNTVFAAGDAISVYNNSAASITITQNSSVTMYLGGTATTGNRTLAQRGIATLLCVAANNFVISGAGLT
jgi:hypothetical protein